MPHNNLQSHQPQQNKGSSGGASGERSPELQRQLDCKAKGGEWDALNKVCIMPPPKVPEIKAPKEKDAVTKRRITRTGEDITGLSEEDRARKLRESRGITGEFELEPKQTQEKSGIGVFKDIEGGELSGINVRGRDFFGLAPDEVSKSVTEESLQRELPIGGQAESVLERQRQQLQAQGFSLATSRGSGAAPTAADHIAELESEMAPDSLSYVAAFKSASFGVVADLISGAKTGAVVGIVGASKTPVGKALLSHPIGRLALTYGATGIAIGYAIGNAITGFLSDSVSNLRKQQSALIEAPIRTLSETKPVLNDIINSQNANPANLEENELAFWTQMRDIDESYEDLKDTTDHFLNDFLGDLGINQLTEFEVFYSAGGERDRLIYDFRLAQSNPDPARIRINSISMADINKRIEEELSK